jgi:hypothetical protein
MSGIQGFTDDEITEAKKSAKEIIIANEKSRLTRNITTARFLNLLWLLLTSHQFLRTSDNSPGKSIFPTLPVRQASSNPC